MTWNGAGTGDMNWRNIQFVVMAATLALQLGGVAASADDKRKGSRESTASQQDEILAAVKRGEIRPLSEAQAVAEAAVPGAVVGVDVERRKGRLVYEFKIIIASGRVREIYIDATTLAVVKVE